MPKLFAQKWIEYESGCGERPDGYSLHLRAEDIPLFEREEEKQVAARLAAAGIDESPDECKHALGEPFEVEIDEMTYGKVKQSQFGLKFHEEWSEIENKKTVV
jgi:hypothetical protein